MKFLSLLMSNLTRLVSCSCCSNRHAVLTRSIRSQHVDLKNVRDSSSFCLSKICCIRCMQHTQSMISMLIFFLGSRDYSESFLAIDSQFKMNEIFHCSDFDSLLLKHESQMFHLRYACILQSISSLITSIHTTVFSSYTDDVFN